MNNQTTTNLVMRSTLAFAFALAIYSPVHAQSTGSSGGKDMAAATMMGHCQEMKEQKQKMQDDMSLQAAQLTGQIAEMNRAPEAKKMDLMAAVITRMVEQRNAMDARKAKMEAAMMQHMMQHMEIGKDSMSQCPMMKSADKTPGEAKKEP